MNIEAKRIFATFNSLYLFLEYSTQQMSEFVASGICMQ